MASVELGSVIQTLKAQEAKLIEVISELEETLKQHSTDLEKIRGAIASLDPSLKPSRKKRKASVKPSASKADVEAALMAAKDSNPEATDGELREFVENRLAEQGFSRSGLALRFKQLLTPNHSDQVAHHS